MIEGWAAALEAMALAAALRDSVWSYPLVNALHILGVALLLGAILPLDLRLLGAWRSVPLAPLCQVLTRTAGAGLILAAACGALLFMTRATEYVASSLFLAKMTVVGLGTANALLLRRAPAALAARDDPPPRLRLAAAVSLVSWISALTLGRLIGYF